MYIGTRSGVRIAGLACLRWSTTNDEDHSAVAREKPDNRTALNVFEQFEVVPFRVIRDVVHVVCRNYEIPARS